MIQEQFTDTSDREVISTRIFDTTRERLFNAWTNPEQLAKWWGPSGFSNTFHEFDLQAGGYWRFTMHGPNGANYENESVFVSIQTPNEIILDHISAPKFRVVATFIDQGGKTRLSFRQIFETHDLYEKLKSFVTDANEQNFDRLEALIAELYH